MIKWECSFNIPEASVQVATALVKITSFETNGIDTSAIIQIFDETETTILKEYVRVFAQSFNSETEIYSELLKEYQPGILI